MSSENQDKNLKVWKTRAFKIWAIIGAIILLVGVFMALDKLHDFVLALIIAVLVVFFLHGIVNFFQKKGLKRIWGTLIAFVIFFIVIIGIALLIIPAIATQVADFAQKAPALFEELRIWADGLINGANLPIDEDTINEWISNLETFIKDQAGSIVSGFASGFLGALTSIGGGLMAVLIALLAAFWILIDLPKISEELRKLFKDEYQDTIDLFSQAFGTAIYGWARATIICAVVTGIITGIILAVIGFPYATTIASIAGITYIIPYLGPIIAGILIVLIGLIVSPWIAIGGLVVFFVVVNVVANVLSPRLMKSSVNVHPAITMFVLLIGSGLGGAIGMFASIPIAAAIQSIFVTIFEEKSGKKLYTPDGALFHSNDASAENKLVKEIDKHTTKFKRVKSKEEQNNDDDSPKHML
ncbi:MAG: AI-2E family transporter [Coriobacteriales bacterium]|nr:AI-2E family transporter [Coriobacteriales bacterium]